MRRLEREGALGRGTAVRLACSWWIAAGQDCVVQAAVHGTAGGVALRLAWSEALAAGGRFDPEIASILEVQATLDRIYEL